MACAVSAEALASRPASPAAVRRFLRVMPPLQPGADHVNLPDGFNQSAPPCPRRFTASSSQADAIFHLGACACYHVAMDLLVFPDDDGWCTEVAGKRFRCAIGHGGIRPAEEKREGDGATPLGRWPLRSLLYRADRGVPPPTWLTASPI